MFIVCYRLLTLAITSIFTNQSFAKPKAWFAFVSQIYKIMINTFTTYCIAKVFCWLNFFVGTECNSAISGFFVVAQSYKLCAAGGELRNELLSTKIKFLAKEKRELTTRFAIARNGCYAFVLVYNHFVKLIASPSFVPSK